MDERLILLELSHIGALERFVDMTTKQLGDIMGTSQQSASIYLNRLEARDLIERIRKRDGSSVRITQEGMDLLLGLYGELRSVFETSRVIDVRGHVSRGLGEGAYYLSQKPYKEQLKERFGIDPFEGTLNIELARRDSPVLDLLRKGRGVKVAGFRSQGRSFGSCICYPCMVNGRDAVIMIPNRTLHSATLEVVSNVKLRDHLGLEDGDDVTVSITFPVAEK
jgi:riboflavin kinase